MISKETWKFISTAFCSSKERERFKQNMVFDQRYRYIYKPNVLKEFKMANDLAKHYFTQSLYNEIAKTIQSGDCVYSKMDDANNRIEFTKKPDKNERAINRQVAGDFNKFAYIANEHVEIYFGTHSFALGIFSYFKNKLGKEFRVHNSFCYDIFKKPHMQFKLFEVSIWYFDPDSQDLQLFGEHVIENFINDLPKEVTEFVNFITPIYKKALESFPERYHHGHSDKRTDLPEISIPCISFGKTSQRTFDFLPSINP